jgi:hypothetical protein
VLGTGVLSLIGCGAAKRTATVESGLPPATSAGQPFTPYQHEVERGARLVVADGCTACHLTADGHVAPNFETFAGHRFRLTTGRRVLVDEHFVTRALLHPGRYVISGYSPAPMLAVARRLKLAKHPGDVAAIAAFIEQVGPETE